MDTSEDAGDVAEPKSNSVLILQRGDETPKTRRSRSAALNLLRRAAYHENAALLPPGTSLDLGNISSTFPTYSWRLKSYRSRPSLSTMATVFAFSVAQV